MASPMLTFAAERARVERMVATAGLAMPNRPQSEAVAFPSDLSELTSDALSLQLSYWASMHSYALVQAATMDSAASRREADYEIAQARAYTNSADVKGQTVTDKKNSITSRSEIVNLRIEVSELKAAAKTLAAVAKSYEVRYNACSRELSRRESERFVR